jgi:hypothetical protein
MSPADELKKFFETAPLYRQVIIILPADIVEGQNLRTPQKISILCGECDHPTNWELDTTALRPLGNLAHVIYHCANCKNSSVTFIILTNLISTAELAIQKVGQFPPQEVIPSKAVKKALGDRLSLYVKGMTCRQHSFGIGAHAYFRRLIEETTGDMLDALADALRELGVDPTALKKVEQAKQAQPFDEKVRLAAEVFPEHLRPGGQNPFGLLHTLLSRGLHTLSDDECLEIVDDMKDILEYVFKELKAYVAERKVYAERLKVISARASRKPDKASG